MSEGLQNRIMPVELVELVLLPDHEGDTEILKSKAAKSLKIELDRVKGVRLVKRSLDARKRPVKYRLKVEVGVDEPLPEVALPTWNVEKLSRNVDEVVIVGCGPAGMFAALRCIEMGVKPIVLERGKDASSRRFDLAPILREGIRGIELLFWRGRGRFRMGSCILGRKSGGRWLRFTEF